MCYPLIYRLNYFYYEAQGFNSTEAITIFDAINDALYERF